MARTLRIVVTVILGAGFAGLPVVPAGTAGAATGTQIIKNGGAEKGVGSADGSTVPVPNWSIVPNGTSFTAVQYGAPGGFPDANTPGPAKRGKNFFAGGATDALVIAQQSDSLKLFRDAIRSGKVTYALDGSLGGFASQNDDVEVDIYFFDRLGHTLANDFIGPVTAADRDDVTALDIRESSGIVPKRAVRVLVQMTFTREADTGYNDGYADNISLRLFGV